MGHGVESGHRVGVWAGRVIEWGSGAVGGHGVGSGVIGS